MLQGDVQSLNFSTILQEMAADEKSGVLTLRQGERHLHVWFARGLIRLVGLPGGRGPSIPRGLVAVGALAAEDLPVPGATRRQEKSRIQKLLKDTGIGRDVVRQALMHQMTEHLCEALVWSPADFTFDQADAPDDERFDLAQEDWDVVLSGEALMMEALRRTDEMEETRKALVPASEILVPTDAPLPEDADETTERLFEAINGEASIAELMDGTHLGPFAVFKSVGILQAAGCVKSLALKDVIQRALNHVARKDWARALRLCEYGLDREPARWELRQTAARCCQALGEDGRAVAEFRRLAATHLDEGRHEDALVCYGRILELAPDDIDAHERGLHLRLSHGDHAGAHAALGELTRAAQKAGLPDKVRDASAKVLEAIGQDEDLLEQLADLQLQLGERKEASRLFKDLLHRALQEGRDEPAIRFARTLIKIHPRTKELRDILERLESGEHLRQRIQHRMRRIKITVAAVALVVLLAGGYELAARLDLSRRRSAVLEATVEGRLADALAEYGGFLDRWSFTWVRREVRADLNQLERSFAGVQAEEAQALHQQGQVEPAIAQLTAAAALLHDHEARDRVDTLRSTWEQERSSLTNELVQEVRALAATLENEHDEAAAKALGEIRDPMAVPVLRELLRRPAFRVRRRAVESLGLIGTFEAGLGMVEALTDTDPGIRKLACARLNQHLVARGSESPAEEQTSPSAADRVAWDRALREAWLEEVPAARVQTTLQQDRGQEEALILHWRITNLSSEPVTLRLDEPANHLTVLDQEEVPRPTTHADASEPRTLVLGPGEYFGGPADLAGICADLVDPGRYRLFWNAPVSQDGEPLRLDGTPLVVEVGVD